MEVDLPILTDNGEVGLRARYFLNNRYYAAQLLVLGFSVFRDNLRFSKTCPKLKNLSVTPKK